MDVHPRFAEQLSHPSAHEQSSRTAESVHAGSSCLADAEQRTASIQVRHRGLVDQVGGLRSLFDDGVDGAFEDLPFLPRDGRLLARLSSRTLTLTGRM
jgi:hypothetical protein